MMIEPTTAIGFLAGALTSLSAAPQVWQIYQRRSGKNISYKMFITLSTGLALWIWYGILLDQWALIIANAVSLCLNLAVIFFKWKFSGNQEQELVEEQGTPAYK